ncbi:hypothetical protein HBB16_21525 [Pseudonocardia sp. MCCB 268]|nr:hypothetical protein [Pseudonocardia cytotoxica]
MADAVKSRTLPSPGWTAGSSARSRPGCRGASWSGCTSASRASRWRSGGAHRPADPATVAALRRTVAPLVGDVPVDVGRQWRSPAGTVAHDGTGGGTDGRAGVRNGHLEKARRLLVVLSVPTT